MPAAVELHKHYTHDKLLSTGRGLYQQQRYAEALECFDAAVRTGEMMSLEVFDDRAATNEKLGDLQAALRDAREMIKRRETASSGYLRAGKILQKMEKPDAARQIYERGIRLAAPEDPQYQLLQKMIDKLAGGSSPAVTVNFFQVLPTEVQEMIWSFVPFRDQCKCLRVSKAWHRTITAWPSLWREIDTSTSPQKKVSEDAVMNYVKYANYTVARAVVTGLDSYRKDVLSKLVNACKGLEFLHFNPSSFCNPPNRLAWSNLRLKHISISGKVRLLESHIRPILKNCPNLAEVEFCGVARQSRTQVDWASEEFPNLRSFTLYWDTPRCNEIPVRQPVLDLSHICPKADGLKVLRLGYDQCKYEERGRYVFDSGIMALEHLEELTLRDLQLVIIPRNQSITTLPIQRLHIKDCDWTYSLNPGVPASGLTPRLNLPNLVELRVKGNSLARPEIVQAFLRRPTQDDESVERSFLKVMDIKIFLFNDDSVIRLISEPRLQHLEELNLSGAIGFDDSVVDVLTEKMRDMQRLDLSSTKVTGVGIRKLVNSLEKLTWLNLDLCFELGGDAVEWARAQGVRVQHQLSPR